MGDQTIDSQNISVAGLFHGFYKVPDYQREFAWDHDHVEQFLEDIEKARTDSEEPDEYFIGSIVVCCSKSGRDDNLFELIDGQQRVTTLFLILCALRAHLQNLNEGSESIGKMIRDVYPNRGRDQTRYRLDLQYKDSQKILEKIASDDWNNSQNDQPQTVSIKNITRAYTQISEELNKLPDTDDPAQKYYDYFDYLNTKVKLIRIETEDVAKALMIFETINDRGVGLNAMDLLKNLLFMRASEQDFQELKSNWKQLKKIISDAKEKPLRFLRYFILSNYPISELRQDKVYKKILEHPDIKSDYIDHPIEFTKKLIESAEAYLCFTKSLDAEENSVPYLENITFFAGKAARQHFILLLAGMHLKSAIFRDFAQAIENLFFVHIVTRQQTNTLEGKFAKWADEIRNVKNQKDMNYFLKAQLEPAKNNLSIRFSEAFERMSEKEVKRKYVLRYILDKLAQFIDMNADQVEEERLGIYKQKFEIEHIHPQDPSDEAKKEFGECPEDMVGMLGNLTLLEKPRNRHLKNKPFSEKKTVYGESKTFLTSTIAKKMEVGNSSITRAVKNLETYDEWNRRSVERRQSILTNLAHKVWNVDESKHLPNRESTVSPSLGENQSQSTISSDAPTQIKVFEKVITVHGWRDAMIKFLIEIYECNPEGLYSLVDEDQRAPVIRRTPSPHKSHVPVKIGDSGLWINKHGAATTIRKKCREIEKLLGHDEGTVLTFMSGSLPHKMQT